MDPDDPGRQGPLRDQGDRPVSTLELFFDLLFVFAITQLTAVLAVDPTPRGVLQVLLAFGVLWWMFGGYVWLTNAIASDTTLRRLLLLAAMVGFLVMGLALPTAFDGGGLVFGLGYLLVILIHAGLFAHAQKGSGITGIFRVAPLNITAALVLVAAGLLNGPIVYVVWTVALGLEVLTTFLVDPGGFRIAPRHFVERHGLLLIIVLGESIVAISAGAVGLELDTGLIVAATLALAVASCLWWLYFAEDDRRVEDAMVAAPTERRARIALNFAFYAQIPMVLGVVSFATGVKAAIGHAFEPLPPYAAAFLAAGIALYLVGDALLRLAIGWGHAWMRTLAAGLALATIPIGLAVSSVAQLAALFLLLVVTLALRERTSSPIRSEARATVDPA